MLDIDGLSPLDREKRGVMSIQRTTIVVFVSKTRELKGKGEI